MKYPKLIAGGVASTLALLAASPAVSGPTKLVITERDDQFHQLDNPPTGESAGDLFAITERLYDRTGHHRIGRADISAVETDVSHHLAEITATFSLPHGEISIQGVQPFKRPRFTAAVIGGTGKYAGARGSVQLDGPRGRYTFTLR